MRHMCGGNRAHEPAHQVRSGRDGRDGRIKRDGRASEAGEASEAIEASSKLQQRIMGGMRAVSWRAGQHGIHHRENVCRIAVGDTGELQGERRLLRCVIHRGPVT